MTTTVLSLRGVGGSLEVAVERQTVSVPGDPWYDTRISVDAPPFIGTIDTVFTLTDLHQWADALSALGAGPGRAVLGGGRAAEVVIVAEPQQGGDSGSLALAVEVTPSGDDPYPLVRFLVLDVPPTWSDAGAGFAALR